MNRVENIFIIDDDPITIFGIRKMLCAMEVAEHIHTYANGELALEAIEALNAAGKRLPEVIFLDINIVTSSIDPNDLDRYHHIKSRTSHILEYRNKPLCCSDLEEITRAA